MNKMGAVPLHPAPFPLSFSGDRAQFRRLVTRGAGLELFTAGFYRFWLATDIRRHLWSNTTVDGDAFEYTGRGKELLIGFLFALAILVPIYLGYFLLSVEVERYQQFASFPLLSVVLCVRSVRDLPRPPLSPDPDDISGVRFWMDGSAWGYASRATLWGLLMLLTLGLALPWREAALERYKLKHSYYGGVQGSFEGRGWDFFKHAWWLWLLAPFAVVIFPLAPFLYAEFKAVKSRWWLSGIRFGSIRLESTLRRNALYGPYWKAVAWSAALSAAFALLFGQTFLAGIDGASHDPSLASGATANGIPSLIAAGLGYLTFILSLNVVVRVYLLRDVWARALASVNVHGMELTASVSAKAGLASALGEGFADGLDVAGF